MAPLLSVNHLVVQLKLSQGTWLGVNDFTFEIKQQETVCITGESGAGKTLSILAILGLLPINAAIQAGSIYFNGKNMLDLSSQQKRDIRGSEIGVVFQEPGSALNPVMKIGDQIKEIFQQKENMNKKEALEASIALLDKVGIRQPQQIIKQYPYQLSGGMQQRVLIAMAISRKPKLLIADEPTTALDATIQAQIVELIQQLQEEIGLTVLWITHDLSLAARVADRTVIIYAGKNMETGPTHLLLEHPHHPYTKGLLQSMPQYALRHACTLKPIKGTNQNTCSTKQCVFYARCEYARPTCKLAQPPLREISAHHQTACWNHESKI